MLRSTLRRISFSLWIAGLYLGATAADATAQPRRPAERSSSINADSNSDIGAKFFEQLRTLFGRFRDSELDRAFEAAQPIQCTELISDNGEWRTVAFFNEDPTLGAWYHRSLEEVKSDFTQYIFSGSCTEEHSGVQVLTKVPVLDSLERYNAGRIHLNEIRLNTNPAVRASFNSRAQIYVFDLPYLYMNQRRASRDPVYSLIPQHVEDRVDPTVTNHWECKAVRANDVTFQFLICQTWVLPRDPSARRQSRPSFGSSAYYILSDGKEALTSVKLSFGGEENDVTGKSETPPQPDSRPPVSPDRPSERTPAAAAGDSAVLWKIPDDSSKLVDLKEDEFRIIFSPQTWAGKITSSQVLIDQKIVSPDTKPPAGTDYCTWRPSSLNLAPRALAKEPDAEVEYTLNAADATRQSPTSISFDLKTHNGGRLGTLQCLFPRNESASAISFGRWIALVGAHITIEAQR